MARDHRHGLVRRIRWRAMVLLAAVLTILSAASAPPSRARADPTGSTAPHLRWTDCGEGFACARVSVPLDYDKPNGRHISLALIRLPATDQRRRIGSLLTNFGGPGLPAIDRIRAARDRLPVEIRARFDVIGMDPRGVGESSPLRCFPDQATQEQVLGAVPLFPRFPVGRGEQDAYVSTMRRLGEACLQRNADLMHHMSTANVARDLDLLRGALGDDGLTFYGASYGSYLGMVYANLYPRRVRALVFDSVVDPDEWADDRTADPLFLRQGSDRGAAATLREFFRLCDLAGSACAFSGGHPEDRYRRLLARARRSPIVVRTSAGEASVGYADIVGLTLAALFEPDSWPSLGETLQALDETTTAGRPAALPLDLASRLVAGPADTAGSAPSGYDNQLEALLGVACTDSSESRDVSVWPQAAARADRRSGPFGSPWAWSSEACATWPARDDDRYRGPFRHPTPPVLLVGTRYDPALPYSNATHVAGELPNSRLLTLDGWGHVAMPRSTCIARKVARYLVTVQPPPAGMTCEPDRRPFPPPDVKKGTVPHD